VKPISKTIQYAFIVGVSFCFIGALVISHQYKQALSDMQIAQESNFESLEQIFFNEKILGMHFIYHTRFCEFDGWRPPVHEPVLVLGIWLNGGVDPLNVSLEERIELYKIHFPENRIKFDCSCALEEAAAYHQDLRLQ
jgi:hypothetical protein